MAAPDHREPSIFPEPLRYTFAIVLGGLKYAFIAATLVSILHYNVFVKFLLPEGYSIHHAKRQATGLEWLYCAATVHGGEIGLWSEWKMYSPVWRKILRVDWYAQRESGEWEKIYVPNLSPEYREKRSVLDAWLWDFKLARIYDNYFAYPATERFRRGMDRYVAYHRPIIDEQLGWKTASIRIHAHWGWMPAPDEKGDWTPQTAVLDKTLYKYDFPSP